MKTKIISPLLLVALLSSCNQANIVIEDNVFCFATMIDVKLFEGEEKDKTTLHNLFIEYDALSDNYQLVKDINNVSSINQTNEEIEVDARLYKMLETAFKVDEIDATNFNPLCGSLIKAWKDSLAKKEVLSTEVIASELAKMNSSSFSFKENNVVSRSGEAEVDLGGIAKGYVLDEVYSYLTSKEYKHYLVNAGSSSILLGEKDSKDGLFNVGIDSKILSNKYLKLKNCFISTSSISEQGVEIDEKMYSHIIDPKTGNAINEQDAVIVVSNKGYIGDALSTSMMLNTVEEIKEIEKEQNVKCIVVKNKQVVYINNELEIFNR